MAVTKVLNVVSSLVATLLFAMRGMIDWKLGAILSLAAFTGALVGAVFARRMSNLWLRRVFLGAVVILAGKMLLFDVDWKSYWPPSRAISAKSRNRLFHGIVRYPHAFEVGSDPHASRQVAA
jgi:uncharacterized membrane protein YfcA